MALTTTIRNDDFFGDMDRLMETALGRFFGGRNVSREIGLCDCVEHGDHFELVADFPGYDEKDIVIEQQDGYLTLRGEKKNNNEKKSGKWHRKERYYSNFYRSFLLPENIDADNITAKLDKGVLHINLPKLENLPSKNIRRITIT